MKPFTDLDPNAFLKFKDELLVYDIHHDMLLPRLQPPLRAAIASIGRSGASANSQICLNDAFAQLSLRAHSPALTFVRHASHAQQGAVNKAKDGPGKRLGAKKSGGELIITPFRSLVS